VVLTAFPGAHTLRRALASGARGFVLKAAGSRALLSALSCVAHILGKTPSAVSREIANLLQRMGVSSRAGAVNQALQRSDGLLA
jgi:DNA-binding NarL/FixJ family response regulator